MVKRGSYAKLTHPLLSTAWFEKSANKGSLTFPTAQVSLSRSQLWLTNWSEQIEAGNIDFDVLLYYSNFYPKLAKFARVLRTKRFDANQRTAPLLKTQLQKERTRKGKVTIKSEKKLHWSTWSSVKNHSRATNLLLTSKHWSPLDARLKKLTISAAMGPGIKVKNFPKINFFENQVRKARLFGRFENSCLFSQSLDQHAV